MISTKQEVQYLSIDLYTGGVEVNKKVTVDISNPVVPQVLEQVIEDENEEERQEEIKYLTSNMKSTSTGYKFHGDECLILILL